MKQPQSEKSIQPGLFTFYMTENNQYENFMMPCFNTHAKDDKLHSLMYRRNQEEIVCKQECRGIMGENGKMGENGQEKLNKFLSHCVGAERRNKSYDANFQKMQSKRCSQTQPLSQQKQQNSPTMDTKNTMIHKNQHQEVPEGQQNRSLKSKTIVSNKSQNRNQLKINRKQSGNLVNANMNMNMGEDKRTIPTIKLHLGDKSLDKKQQCPSISKSTRKSTNKQQKLKLMINSLNNLQLSKKCPQAKTNKTITKIYQPQSNPHPNLHTYPYTNSHSHTHPNQPSLPPSLKQQSQLLTKMAAIKQSLNAKSASPQPFLKQLKIFSNFYPRLIKYHSEQLSIQVPKNTINITSLNTNCKNAPLQVQGQVQSQHAQGLSGVQMQMRILEVDGENQAQGNKGKWLKLPTLAGKKGQICDGVGKDRKSNRIQLLYNRSCKKGIFDVKNEKNCIQALQKEKAINQAYYSADHRQKKALQINVGVVAANSRLIEGWEQRKKALLQKINENFQNVSDTKIKKKQNSKHQNRLKPQSKNKQNRLQIKQKKP